MLDRYEHVLSQINSVATQRLTNPSTQVIAIPCVCYIIIVISLQIDIMKVTEDPCALAQQLTHIELVNWACPVFIIVYFYTIGETK